MISRMTTAPVPLADYVPSADRRIVLRTSWEGFEALLAVRGDRSAPRMTFLDGAVELMSPSFDHEKIKSNIGGLVEAFCLERGIAFSAVGSWLLKDKVQNTGVEPDECYVFDRDPRSKSRPDLTIEVVWTREGIEKLECYRRLRVGEVWLWDRDKLTVFVLGDEGYTQVARSALLPELDLDLVCRLAAVEPMSDAILQFREILRSGS